MEMFDLGFGGLYIFDIFRNIIGKVASNESRNITNQHSSNDESLETCTVNQASRGKRRFECDDPFWMKCTHDRGRSR